MIPGSNVSGGTKRPLPWLRNCFFSMRPLSSVVAGLMTSAVFWAKSGLSLLSVSAGLAMFTLTGFGFVINDILDYRKDAAAGVERPVARGLLSRRSAGVFALALLAVTALLSFWIGSGGGVLAATALALTVYTPAAHQLSILKGLFVAVLCAAPLYYGSVVSHTQYAWPLYLFMTLFVVGREARMDANELDGDLAAGLVTVAALLGRGRAKWIGLAIMALSLAGLGLVAGGWFARMAAIVALAALLAVFGWPHVQETRRIELSRIPMLAAVLAIACG